jgi:diguanylate cyclase (GGDEF)-like protein
LGAIDAAGDLCYEWDLTSGAIQWAGRVEDLFGSSHLSGIGTADGFANLINVEDLPQRLKALSDHLGREAPFDCEYRVRTADGQFVWVHDRGSVRRRTDGSESRLIGTLRLVTERKRNEVRLERLASFDELTGHYNLPRLRDALEHATTYASRYGLAGAYVVVGIDRLALINSTHGFEAGDAVLIAVGRRLDECLRSSDVIGRVGADRFGVVLSQCSPEQLAAAADRILQAVRSLPIETSQLPVHVTVSIGGVIFPASGNTAYELMAKAETALKQAKREGRDTYVEYRPSERQGALSRRSLDIAIQVQEAMKDGRLTFAFQPVVRAQDQETAFYECLVRMRDETGDLVPAAAFVPAIEQLGLVRLVDRHVLDLALNELAQDSGVKLAINISGLTVTDRSWLRSLIAVLKSKPELADRLIIEITETAALHDIEESARFVSAVRDLGCRVALDDFGAGFTSFRHLRALAIDIVKIDGSFVRNLTESVDNQLFIRNLLGLANAFNLSTVAECIESADEAAFLVNEGVHLLQGYYFGRPVLGRPWLEQRQAAAKPRLRVAN